MRHNPYDVGPGWWAMLDEELAMARAIVPDVQHEEKEKYGRCDLYFSSETLGGSSNELFAIEAEIEERSLKICEFCGRPGKLREERSWMQTLCDRCAALDPLERRKVAEDVKEQYFHGSHLRHSEPGSRGGVREKRLYDFLKEEGCFEELSKVYEKAGKRLAYILRHCTEPLYIDLKGGWAPVRDILRLLDLKRGDLDAIVATDNKGRYSFDTTGTKIRANQGHSIPGVVIDMERPEPPELLYHGTATRFLDDIMLDGLKPMSRQYVHISSDFETAVQVGKRHGKPVVLVIRAKEFVADGHDLFLSANGVWQAQAVPAFYFDIRYVEEN